MKVVVAGGRDFQNYSLLKAVLDWLVPLEGVTEIVSGTARGADSLGERYAKESNLDLKQFPANWNAHGKSAGYLRNSEMADYADAVLIFWDGKSRGTGHMIELAKKKGRPLIVFDYSGNRLI